MVSNAVRQPVVAHVVESCDGGIATIVTMIIESQRKDPKFGMIHLLVDQNSKSLDLRASANVVHSYYSSRNPLQIPRISAELSRLLRKIEPDVVVLHSTFPGVWGRLRTRQWRTVYCAHGWAFNRDTSRLAKKVYGAIEGSLSYLCDAIVSISSDEYVSARRAGVRDRDHRIIPHGMDWAQPATDFILLPKSTRIDLAFVGRFERAKGIDILFEIFDDARLDEICVWIVGGDVRGTGEYRLPQRPNLRFLGWLERPYVDAVLSQVDALIAPSRWEAFGLAAVEAMRNGKPVIASRVGGLTEIVTDGANGKFFDVTDIAGCREILMSLDRNTLEKWGKAALEKYIERYSWDACYNQWRDIILGKQSSLNVHPGTSRI